MALAHTHFFSDSLGMSTSMQVLLPQTTRRQIGLRGGARRGSYPVLYLLHGLSDDHTTWLRRTSLERYAADLPLIVVMPEVQRSFYTDMAHGPRYFEFITEELPTLCHSFFPLTSEPHQTFIAGLSMGGYGAWKAALTHPARYGAAGSFSGTLDLVARMRHPASEVLMGMEERVALWGVEQRIEGTGNDLLHLAEGLRADSRLPPPLFQCCGNQDFLIACNRRVRDFCQAAGFDLSYQEWDGQHSWDFWDEAVRRFLRWLPLDRESS